MTMHRRTFHLLVLGTLLTGCRSPAADALALEDDHAALRRLQTRRFATQDEAMVLQASAALLQDLGFNLDDSETDVGLIVGSKNRSAVEAGQVVGAVIGTIVVTAIAVVLAAAGGGGGGTGDTTVAYDERQYMRACLVTHPDSKGVLVRINFQRIVWDSKGRISRREALQEPHHYEEFFDRLSKAVFLEAHQL